jgi:non-ribosomal peptide synthase protein (TIGR01720 family)
VIPYAEEEEFNMHSDRLQSTIDLEKGPLFRAALFKGKEEDRLLLVAHHLVIDGVSWRILFEDLSNLYHQYQLGVSLALPLKTDSFKYWQEQLSAYASTEALQAEHAHWSSIESFAGVASLPQDHPHGSNLMKDTALQSFLLDRETTSRLLTKTYEAYRTEINDVLIAALGLAMKEVFGLPHLLLQLEGHGRENIGADTDISRTVGWFTTIYPVLINLHHSAEPIRQLIEVKETLHRVPNKGIGYGVLRYLAARPYKCAPQVSFNYLGDFDGGIKGENGEQLFGFSAAHKGKEIPDEMPRDTLLDISGMTVGGQTRLSIAYSSARYETATIRRLTGSWQQQLESLIMQLAEEKETLTPVDLTYKGLSVEQLKQLNETL